MADLLGRGRNIPDQAPEGISGWHADVLAQPARPVMIFRHERASAVRIAVNSNTIIVMPGGGLSPPVTSITTRPLLPVA